MVDPVTITGNPVVDALLPYLIPWLSDLTKEFIAKKFAAPKSDQLSKAEVEYLKAQEKSLNIQEASVELQRAHLEWLREQHVAEINLALKKIQADYDKEHWAGILSREETVNILVNGQKQHRLLVIVSEPDISRSCPASFIDNLPMQLRGELKQWLEYSYPLENSLCPVEFYGKFFKTAVFDTQVKQLETLLSAVPTVVIYSDLTDEKLFLHLRSWGLPTPLSQTIILDWETVCKQWQSSGIDKKQERLKQVRQVIVNMHQLLAAFLADIYYLNVNPLHEPRLFQSPQITKTQELADCFTTLRQITKTQEFADCFTTLRQLQEQRRAAYEKEIEREVLMNQKVDIITLRDEVIKLISDARSLMWNANEKYANPPLKNKEASEQYKGWCTTLEGEISKVKNLELVMAVVAPMSAGKSTIINAIVGQELLPSRNTATTTLPTKIYLKEDLTEPVLTFNDDTVKWLKRTQRQLKQVIKDVGKDKIREEKLKSYSHLGELLDKIADGEDDIVRQEVCGQINIHKVLTNLNDMIRLCILIEPSLNPLSESFIIPEIKTSFPKFPDTQLKIPANLVGNLVIVDTPGPSESMEHGNLLNVVTVQLERSSIALFVLDFTQLKTKAAEEVKNEVKKLVDSRGKDKLYILVNKIDERIRDKSSLSKEQVREFVEGELEITESDHLFEIAARSAFRATDFWFYQVSPSSTDFLKEQSVTCLFNEAFGDTAEKVREIVPKDNEEEFAKRIANQLWESSGFEVFLEKAVIALMEKAAPRSISSALQLCDSFLANSHNQLSIGCQTVSAELHVLKTQIDELEKDLAQLETYRQQGLDRIPETLKAFEIKVDEAFGQVTSGVKSNLADKFGDTWLNWFGDIVREIFTSEGFQTEFSDRKKAQAYADEKGFTLLNKVKELVEKANGDIRDQAHSSYHELRQSIEKEAKNVLDNASKRLGKAFKVELEQPNVNLPPFNVQTYFSSFEKVGTKYDEKVIDHRQERRSFFWIFGWTTKVPVTQTEKKFVVGQQDLIQWAKRSALNAIDATRKQLEQQLQLQFTERVKQYFDEATAYLKGYHDGLKHDRDNHERNKEQRVQIKGILEELRTRTEKLRERVRNCYEQNSQFLK